MSSSWGSGFGSGWGTTNNNNNNNNASNTSGSWGSSFGGNTNNNNTNNNSFSFGNTNNTPSNNNKTNNASQGWGSSSNNNNNNNTASNTSWSWGSNNNNNSTNNNTNSTNNNTTTNNNNNSGGFSFGGGTNNNTSAWGSTNTTNNNNNNTSNNSWSWGNNNNSSSNTNNNNNNNTWGNSNNNSTNMTNNNQRIGTKNYKFKPHNESNSKSGKKFYYQHICVGNQAFLSKSSEELRFEDQFQQLAAPGTDTTDWMHKNDRELLDEIHDCRLQNERNTEEIKKLNEMLKEHRLRDGVHKQWTLSNEEEIFKLTELVLSSPFRPVKSDNMLFSSDAKNDNEEETNGWFSRQMVGFRFGASDSGSKPGFDVNKPRPYAWSVDGYNSPAVSFATNDTINSNTSSSFSGAASPWNSNNNNEPKPQYTPNCYSFPGLYDVEPRMKRYTDRDQYNTKETIKNSDATVTTRTLNSAAWQDNTIDEERTPQRLETKFKNAPVAGRRRKISNHTQIRTIDRRRRKKEIFAPLVLLDDEEIVEDKARHENAKHDRKTVKKHDVRKKKKKKKSNGKAKSARAESTDGMIFGRKELLRQSKIQLAKKCRLHHLPSNGTKGDMVNRLLRVKNRN
eukprot:625326_1